jgi:hypothetical protein
MDDIENAAPTGLFLGTDVIRYNNVALTGLQMSVGELATMMSSLRD